MYFLRGIEFPLGINLLQLEDGGVDNRKMYMKYIINKDEV